MPKVTIDREDVTWDGGQRVLIRSIDLLDSLVEDGKDEVSAGLSKTIAPITAEEISVDHHGDVVVRNAGFQAAIEDILWGPTGLGGGNVGCANPACGANAYKCSGGGLE